MRQRQTKLKKTKSKWVWYARSPMELVGPFKTKKSLTEYVSRGSTTSWMHLKPYDILKVHSVATTSTEGKE